MFARTSGIEIAFRILVTVAMLLSAPLNSFSVQAANETATPTETATEIQTTVPTDTPTLTAEPSYTATETAVPVSETPTPSVTPSTTPTVGVTGTGTAAAPSPAIQLPALILSADPSFITPSGNLVVTWTIEGISLDGLTVQIHLPEGVSLQGDDPGTYDEASRTLSLIPTLLTGEVHFRTSRTVSDVVIDAVLLKNGETLASTSLSIPAYEQFVLDQKGGEITAMEGKLKLDFPKDTLSEETVVEIGPPQAMQFLLIRCLANPLRLKHMRRRVAWI